MSKRTEAQEVENWIMKFFSRLRFEITRFYREQTGRTLPKILNSFQIKDLFDRWFFYWFFDRGFVQSIDLKDPVDGTASGSPCELKYNTYGFNEKDEIIIDYDKIHGNPLKGIKPMPDDARIVFLYFKPNFGKRQFLVKDIKKYGRIAYKGGKCNNENCEEKGKPVYYVPHSAAEDEYLYGERTRRNHK